MADFPELPLLSTPHVHGPHCSHGHTPAAPIASIPTRPVKPGHWLALAASGLLGGSLWLQHIGRHTPAAQKQATPESRAEDIAYTINHSLYCTLTDFINPPVNAATDGYLRWLIPGCGHDHSHGPACDHHHPPAQGSRWQRVKAASKQAFSKERFWQYAKGECIGDFGAVPITIGMQRLFPNLMQGIRAVCEPLIRPFFAYGIERSSQRWAQRNHIAPDSAEYAAHKAQIYEHEMAHFPQAVIWTAASLGLNVAYQLHSDKSPLPFARKLALKSSSVLSGVLVTAGVVIAARAFAPHRMHAFDRFNSEHFILPATKALGGIFGVDQETVMRVAQREEQAREQSWAERLGNAPAATMQRG